MATDWSDPCQRAAALSAAYYDLISGGNAVELREGDRTTKFGPGDAEKLKAEMVAAQAACDAANGVKNPASRRFAIGVRSAPCPSRFRNG
jgi:hypothetical protein